VLVLLVLLVAVPGAVPAVTLARAPELPLIRGGKGEAAVLAPAVPVLPAGASVLCVLLCAVMVLLLPVLLRTLLALPLGPVDARAPETFDSASDMLIAAEHWETNEQPG
jgi:hypothetical protein